MKMRRPTSPRVVVWESADGVACLSLSLFLFLSFSLSRSLSLSLSACNTHSHWHMFCVTHVHAGLEACSISMLVWHSSSYLQLRLTYADVRWRTLTFADRKHTVYLELALLYLELVLILSWQEAYSISWACTTMSWACDSAMVKGIHSWTCFAFHWVIYPCYNTFVCRHTL